MYNKDVCVGVFTHHKWGKRVIKEKYIEWCVFDLRFFFFLYFIWLLSLISGTFAHIWFVIVYVLCVFTRNCDNRKIIIDSLMRSKIIKKMYLLLFKEWRKTIIKRRIDSTACVFVFCHPATIVHIIHLRSKRIIKYLYSSDSWSHRINLYICFYSIENLLKSFGKKCKRAKKKQRHFSPIDKPNLISQVEKWWSF